MTRGGHRPGAGRPRGTIRRRSYSYQLSDAEAAEAERVFLDELGLTAAQALRALAAGGWRPARKDIP